MNDAELREIEEAAAELARGAGKLLMSYFGKPLEISYKAPNNRSPVTDADMASDAYLREEIRRRFPSHGIVSEEAPDKEEREAEVVWVVDPLDGTINFMNGLPVFGVSIGVLERARPVVGAIFLPSVEREGGSVLHARAGAGMRCDGIPFTPPEPQAPGGSLLAAMPTYFRGLFKLQPQLRRQLGEVRSTGSVAYEMAFIARGVFQYGVFASQIIWDVAGGIVLIQEAGGSVLQRHSRPSRWTPFQRFDVAHTGALPTPNELRPWRGTLVVGNPKAASFVAEGLRRRSYRWRRLWSRMKRWFPRPGAAAGSRQAAGKQASSPSRSAHASPPRVRRRRRAQSGGQGKSLRE